MVPHGGVLVRGEQAVAGLHASNSHCPLAWLTGHKHWLLVRLLWHRNLLQKKEQKTAGKNGNQATKATKYRNLALLANSSTFFYIYSFL